MRVGEKIYHQFAGQGVVIRLINTKTVNCRWSVHSSGIAYIRDLKKRI